MEEEGEHAKKGLEVLLGLSVGDISYWVDALSLGALLYFATKPFQRLIDNADSKRNHLPYVFEGLGRISMIMQQLGIGSLAISTIVLLEAASKWPPIVGGASLLFFGLAGG